MIFSRKNQVDKDLKTTRFILKSILLNDSIELFKLIYANNACLSRGFMRKAKKTLLKDFNIGLKKINAICDNVVDIDLVKRQEKEIQSVQMD